MEHDKYIESDGQAEDYFTGDESTASLTSSVNDYVFENGRRYHAYFGVDKNPMPTDQLEQDRLDLQHESLLVLLDGDLFKSPVGENPQRILDIGTGTGLWAIDVADKSPSAEVIGVDLSPIQPAFVPPNCRFELDDAEKDWTFAENSFDLIHARNVAQAINDWGSLISNMYRCAKPGGYVELAENGCSVFSDDNSMADDNLVKLYFERMCLALGKTGRPSEVLGSDLKVRLQDAGFVDVYVRRYKLPLAPWPKDKKLKQVGAMTLLASDTGFHAYGMALFTRVLGDGNEKADRYCRAARESMQRYKDVHLYIYHYVVHGRKPF